MTNYIYQDMPYAKRVDMLKRLCKTKETIQYAKSLKEAEIIDENDRFSREAMRIVQMEAELKEIVAKMKGKINEAKKSNAERLDVIANGKRSIVGVVYGLVDTANDRMLFYDEDGELVNSRELFDRERQSVMFIGDEGQTPATSAAVSESVLDQFTEHEEMPFEENAEYEPSVNEEAPNEDDLEDTEQQVRDIHSAADEGQNLGDEDKPKRTRKPKVKK